MTNIRAPELFTPRKRWPPPRVEHGLRAHPDICPAILAADLGLKESYVRMVQRKLGIHRLKTSNDPRDGFRRPPRG